MTAICMDPFRCIHQYLQKHRNVFSEKYPSVLNRFCDLTSAFFK